MKKTYLKWLPSAALLWLLPGHSHAQAVLQAGDIVLLGYDAEAPDDYSFTPVVDLAAGTQLKFIDNDWLAGCDSVRVTHGRFGYKS